MRVAPPLIYEAQVTWSFRAEENDSKNRSLESRDLVFGQERRNKHE